MSYYKHINEFNVHGNANFTFPNTVKHNYYLLEHLEAWSMSILLKASLSLLGVIM